MRSLPAGLTRGAAQFAVDRGGTAGAAGVGAGAPRAKPAGRPRGGEGAVGVATGFGGGGWRGTASRRVGGAVTARAACGIAGFLAVCLTEMVGSPDRRDKESRSAATARSAPWLQRRGGGAVTLLHPVGVAPDRSRTRTWAREACVRRLPARRRSRSSRRPRLVRRLQIRRELATLKPLGQGHPGSLF